MYPMKNSRIFVQPPSGRSFQNITQEAHDILRKAGIASAHLGGINNGQDVVLIDLTDVSEALKTLKLAGLRAAAELIADPQPATPPAVR
jgi:hypothetical protein